MFESGVLGMLSLSNCAMKLCLLIQMKLLKGGAQATDQVYIHPEELEISLHLKGTSYYRAINELICDEFIYPSNLANIFWVNVRKLCNGKRPKIVKESQKKSSMNA